MSTPFFVNASWPKFRQGRSSLDAGVCWREERLFERIFARAGVCIFVRKSIGRRQSAVLILINLSGPAVLSISLIQSSSTNT
jgi:hypothetical protein